MSCFVCVKAEKTCLQLTHAAKGKPSLGIKTLIRNLTHKSSNEAQKNLPPHSNTKKKNLLNKV